MKHPVFRSAVFIAAAVWPLLWLYQAWTSALGPDPGKVLVERLGLGGLILLLLTLSLSPLQWVTRWAGWSLVRRQLGLWTFAYGCLHLVSYLLFILGEEWSQLSTELTERPYIIVGALAWLSLLVLAATSNRFSMRMLGARWKTLHRLVYLILGLVLLHMLWVVRSDIALWTLYFSLGAALMLLRTPRARGCLKQLRQPPPRTGRLASARHASADH
ncbi:MULTISPECIES: protein-methionine-sulfoxide reductase heme-binding subunit MsrQ [Pseudomonadaceae]|uniref:Protein-methionine-sulfoxide reductase heme-binding subunit MsrQ n=1 Tax=Stutzerimonas stutzeri TaxID=316 RepID=A0A172WPR2_STUST|nr:MULTISPECIES: protein-methionine-sulfoxide reductase heme-binding subunit MsrQ [Pseudomonadaceae]AZZ45430.1 protein-methionine-sulfoxide reductase heme-binding subunit MsrQ [Pseudomonadaceae bacterium SI-3]MCH2341593.1 protein-methionine-sulfoxide reductase heme-binding subunit MsrQ [Pseudomonas sp.]BAP81485.1 hypothetical protein MT1_4312 [Pseudomonas sp. MT-1]ANF25478.1 sulfoxide reductase heme-binding subunit YedZ [Stutzerimonas stutzeri]MCQ4284355.1 protein-methionine-sulfoxide reductas|tara:strand:- start:9 stop:656 length:648 start_codon:yes stop_codon:yes gene_type:complete